jgi:DNA repair protein RecO
VKSFRTKAIVLRRTDYGEADRILNVLTPENGIVSAIARGVRREKSKLSGGIELFARCDLTIGQGRGELGIVTGARLDIFYANIMTDYDRLQFGYDVLKQVGKAADNMDESAFFDLVDQSFSFINTLSLDLRIVKTWFWLQLAILLGVGLNLSTDSNGMKLVEDARYNFFESEHSFVFTENGAFNSGHIKLLRLLSAQPPNVAAQVKGIGNMIDDCLWIAERSVAH